MKRLFMISALVALLTPALSASITVTAAPRTGSVRENGRWVFHAPNGATKEAASPRAAVSRLSEQSTKAIAVSAVVLAIFAASLFIHLRRLHDTPAMVIFGLRAWDRPASATKS
ncbi:MAG TPA: hypothetical protein VEZ11_00070 [Thermoanaerobaculia bacterium]|nr:hypothetical protein [Thermoanaerobaculia bacterium]